MKNEEENYSPFTLIATIISGIAAGVLIIWKLIKLFVKKDEKSS